MSCWTRRTLVVSTKPTLTPSDRPPSKSTVRRARRRSVRRSRAAGRRSARRRDGLAAHIGRRATPGREVETPTTIRRAAGRRRGRSGRTACGRAGSSPRRCRCRRRGSGRPVLLRTRHLVCPRRPCCLLGGAPTARRRASARVRASAACCFRVNTRYFRWTGTNRLVLVASASDRPRSKNPVSRSAKCKLARMRCWASSVKYMSVLRHARRSIREIGRILDQVVATEDHRPPQVLAEHQRPFSGSKYRSMYGSGTDSLTILRANRPWRAAASASRSTSVAYTLTNLRIPRPRRGGRRAAWRSCTPPHRSRSPVLHTRMASSSSWVSSILRDELAPDELPRLRISEERRDVDQNGVEELGELAGSSARRSM